MSTPIKLRTYQASDRSFFVQLVRDSERMKFMDGALSEEVAESLFQSLLPSGPRALSAWIALAKGCPVGHGALVERETEESPELLYMVTKEHEGCGFATSIASAVIEKARALEIPQLWATIDNGHSASRRVLEKTQFQFLRRVEEEPVPFLVYSLKVR